MSALRPATNIWWTSSVMPYATVIAIADLPDRLRSSDEGDPGMAPVNQVIDRYSTALDVVNRDRAEVVLRAGPVNDDKRNTPPGHVGQDGGLRIDRRDQDAAHTLLL